MLLFGARQEYAEGDFVSARCVVGEFGDGHVVAVADFEVVLLEAHLEDEGVGILDAVAEPDSDEERHPVEVETIVEVVEASLILIDEVRRKDRCAETQRRGSASFLSDIDKSAHVAGEFHRQLGDAIEAVGRLSEVRSSESRIPGGAINHETSVEVEVPFISFLGHLSGSHTGEAHNLINHIGETQGIPIQASIDYASLEASVDPQFAGQLETESVHHSERAGGESTVVTLTVAHDDSAYAAVKRIHILVVRCRHCGECANQRRPLGAIVQRDTRTHFRTRKGRVHIKRISIELRENHILSIRDR